MVGMTYGEIFERAKSVIDEENINDYRPAIIEGAPDTFFEMRRCIPNTITIWLKNGDWLMYQHKTDNAPAVDAVPVVRCRDCKHWDTDWEPGCSHPKEIHWCTWTDTYPDGDWFCAGGEAKNTDDTFKEWKKMTPSEELSRDIENSYYELGKRRCKE